MAVVLLSLLSSALLVSRLPSRLVLFFSFFRSVSLCLSVCFYSSFFTVASLTHNTRRRSSVSSSAFLSVPRVVSATSFTCHCSVSLSVPSSFLRSFLFHLLSPLSFACSFSTRCAYTLLRFISPFFLFFPLLTFLLSAFFFQFK